jgi:crossover junction endodeoxyribonuclease RuvC
MRRVLGIDPGSRVTGYGVVDSDGRASRHIASGCIRTGDGELAARLGEIFAGINAVLQSTQPHEVAVEQVFMARNAASALILGHARGAAVTAAVSSGRPVFEYSPRSIKQALVGSGGADKQQVQHMVRVILSLEGRLALDASDALAVALCHAHTHATNQRLGRFA